LWRDLVARIILPAEKPFFPSSSGHAFELRMSETGHAVEGFECYGGFGFPGFHLKGAKSSPITVLQRSIWAAARER